MKKYLCLIAIVILLTGCSKKVTCTNTTKSEEGGLKTEAIATLDKEDKVTDITLNFEFDNKETAELICNTFKDFEESTGVKIKCNDTKIKITNAKSFNIAENDDTLKLIGKAKDTFINRAQDEGFSCK